MSTTGALTSVSSTPFDVYVFDFDGTLVDSAAAKRKAFFDVFPPEFAPAVAAILERDPDGSRFSVIPKMIAEAQRRGVQTEGLEASELADAYGSKVEDAVSIAPEMPGAGAALRAAAAKAVYVVSMTPHSQLQDLLARRGWLQFLDGAFGHPHAKSSIVADLIVRHAILPGRLLVVGDGMSDREAADRNGCAYHAIKNRTSILEVPGLELPGHV
jgi:phosphoglycolate phosphatase-like HAD superfamily hydrolase